KPRPQAGQPALAIVTLSLRDGIAALAAMSLVGARGAALVPLFERSRAAVTERGVPALAVVPGLHVLKDGRAGDGTGGPHLAVEQLAFERGAEALRHGVVVVGRLSRPWPFPTRRQWPQA